MLGTSYTVKQGDTLWDLAGKHLGDPNRWPDLYTHNNHITVVNNTGSKIIDPNLIFIGQRIFIPNTAQKPVKTPPLKIPSARPISNPGKAKAFRQVKSVPLKYSLENLPTRTIASPTHILTVALKGSLTLQSKNTVDFAVISTKGFELKAKQEADKALAKLASDINIGFNPSSKELTFECGITTLSKNPYALETTASAGLSTSTGLPVLKATFNAPEIKGEIDHFGYLTTSFSVEVEMTPRSDVNPSGRATEPATAPSKTTPWDYIIGGTLIAGAGVLIIATVVEDIVTLGVGMADDVPSFAAAAAMFVTGLSMFQTVQGGVPMAPEEI